MVGQHLRILKGGKWVHAVDCGDETVLHLVEEAPPPRVRRAYRPEFVAGAEAVEVVTHRERTFPAKEIVRRAYSRASDPALAAMFQDSESFVEWCTTGRLTAARNVALEVPGVAVTPAAPASRTNGKAVGPAKAPASRKVAVAKAKAPPVRKAAPKRAAPGAKPAVRAKAAGGARARPAVKVKARAPAKKGPAPKAKARVAAKTRPAAKAKKVATKGRR